MGAYNMGWGMRCDHCEEQLHYAIEGGWTKQQIEAEATICGWVRAGRQWFCCQSCREHSTTETVGKK